MAFVLFPVVSSNLIRQLQSPLTKVMFLFTRKSVPTITTADHGVSCFFLIERKVKISGVASSSKFHILTLCVDSVPK